MFGGLLAYYGVVNRQCLRSGISHEFLMGRMNRTLCTKLVAEHIIHGPWALTKVLSQGTNPNWMWDENARGMEEHTGAQASCKIIAYEIPQSTSQSMLDKAELRSYNLHHKGPDGCGAELRLHDVMIILDDSCGLLVLLINRDC